MKRVLERFGWIAELLEWIHPDIVIAVALLFVLFWVLNEVRTYCLLYSL